MTLLHRLVGRLTSDMIRLASGMLPRRSQPLWDEGQPLDLARARRILVVSLDEIGDTVLLTPFLRELRNAAPDSWIGLVVQPVSAALVDTCPHIDELFRYRAALPRYLRPLVLPFRAWATARVLRAQPPALAIVPRWDVDQHLAMALALFCGARRRVGYSEGVHAYKRAINAGFDRLLTDVIPGSRQSHQVQRNLDVLRHLGAEIGSSRLELWLEDADRESARAWLNMPEADERESRWVAFGIGARAAKRCWPLERFAALGRSLQQRLGVRIVLVGGQEDRAAQAAVLAGLGPGALGLCGRATLRQTAAVLERCRLFVGNDSAPMHLAAAVGCAVVEISCHPRTGGGDHPNAPERFGPWGVRSRVLRPRVPSSPCTDGCHSRRAHCILQVEVEEALEHASALLMSRGATSRHRGRAAGGEAAGSSHGTGHTHRRL
ncbi:MAG: glycosyltransferase family 9 protein [Longimicrobiaceae bacterium]